MTTVRRPRCSCPSRRTRRLDRAQNKTRPLSGAGLSPRRGARGGSVDDLDDAARARLDTLVRHVELARGVKAVYVDGYTDDTGRRQPNLELSKQRAQQVTDYLVSKGIPAELITTRYHGSRFPVARGVSAAARAENRRVTVRLERG